MKANEHDMLLIGSRGELRNDFEILEAVHRSGNKIAYKKLKTEMKAKYFCSDIPQDEWNLERRYK